MTNHISLAYTIVLLCCNVELLRIADELCPLFPPNPLAVHECVVPARNRIF